jgi:hypothetical protein
MAVVSSNGRNGGLYELMAREEFEVFGGENSFKKKLQVAVFAVSLSRSVPTADGWVFFTLPWFRLESNVWRVGIWLPFG